MDDCIETTESPAQVMHGIRKAFPGVVPLARVMIVVQRAEVHVLLSSGVYASRVAQGADCRRALNDAMDTRRAHE